MLPKNEKVRNVPEVRQARNKYEGACTMSKAIEGELYRNMKDKEYYLALTSRNTETIRNRIDRIEGHIEILKNQHEEAVETCIQARTDYLIEEKLALRRLGIET